VKNIASQLHIILGSLAAMLVAFLALVNGTSPSTCLMKALAAFLVFAGFGLILRYALAEALQEESQEGLGETRRGGLRLENGAQNLDVIVPGTSVAELLAAQQAEGTAADAASEAEESDESAAA